MTQEQIQKFIPEKHLLRVMSQFNVGRTIGLWIIRNGIESTGERLFGKIVMTDGHKKFIESDGKIRTV